MGIFDPTLSAGVYTPELRSATATFNGMGDTLILPLFGRAGAAFQVLTSDLEAEIQFSVSFDGGVTYQTNIGYYDPSTLTFAGTDPAFISSSDFGLPLFVPSGSTHLKAEVTAYTSGTGTITITGTPQTVTIFPSQLSIQGPVTPVAGPGSGSDAIGHISGQPFVINTDGGSLTYGVRNDAAAADLTDTDGDFGPIAVDQKGRVFVGLPPNAAVETGGNLADIAAALAGTLTVNVGLTDAELRATPVPVSGTVTTGGLTDTQLRATPVPISGTVTITDGSGALNVIVDSSALPSGASTLAEQQTQTASLSVLDDWDDGADHARVVGAVADDAAISGNPLTIGGQAMKVRRTAVSAVDDAVRAAFDMYGRQNTIGVALTRAVLQATASGDTAVIAAPSAGSKLRVYRAEFSNSSTSVGLTVGLKFGSGTTFGKKYLPALGGAGVIALGAMYTEGADQEALNVNLSVAGQIETTIFYETVQS